jgi:PAS domain S-box-containing protein
MAATAISDQNQTALPTTTLSLYLGAAPVFLVIVVIAGIRLFLPRSVIFEPTFLVPVLNSVIFLFYGSIAFAAAKGYLISGAPNILLLGAGMLTYGLGAMVSGWALSVSGPDASVAIHNTSALLASILQIVGVVMTMRAMSQRAGTSKKTKAAYLYAGISLVVALVAVLSSTGHFPAYFVQGVGPTLLREVVLAIALVLFGLSSLYFLARYYRTRQPFLYWYGLGLSLLMLCLAAIFLQTVVGDPIGWVGRSAQYLAGIYFLAAVVSVLRSGRTQQVSLNETVADLFHKSERKIASLFAGMTDCYYELDLGWHFTRVNDQCLTFFGRSRDEFIGRLFLDVFPEDRDSIFEEQYKLAFSEGIDVHFEVQSLVVPDRWADVHAYPAEEGLAVFVRDITKRKQTETALRESEQRWATTLASIGDAVIASDTLGRIMFMNAVAEKLTGWTLREASMKPVTEVFNIINERTRGVVESPVAKVIREGMIVGLANHTILVKKDGTEVPIDDSGAPIRDGDGKTTGIVLIFRDITERKRAEEQRAAELDAMTSLQKVSSLFLRDGNLQPIFTEIVDAAIAISEADFGNIQLLDPGSSTLKVVAQRGFPKCWLDFWSGVSEGQGVCGTALEHGERVIVEDVEQSPIFVGTEALDIQLRAGVRAVQSTPLVSRSGRPVGMFSTYYKIPHRPNERTLRFLDLLARQAADIIDRAQGDDALKKAHDELDLRVQERTTELQQAYNRLKEETEQREQVEQQLRQAQKMEALGVLTGGIAHDFNNILAAVIGFTELLHDHVPKKSREARHTARVLEAALRGRELVRQMLTFSRKTEQERKPLQLSHIVKESVRLLRASTPTTISIRTTVKSESGVILGDPIQIQQVLMNLATNAAYAMREKGGSLDIELSDFSVSPSNGDPRGIEPGLYMKLTVRDTGTGMPPDIMDKIFDPFFTTKTVGEGTGLGLSVVLGIVRQSNGYIFAESEPGKGSVFTVYFPKIAGEHETDAVSDDEIPTGSERILFVDDEEALVEMGEELLAELGYEVVCRMSSNDALTLLREDVSRFDLVITDQTMPEMTGVELAQEILTIRPYMPVIMCTGFSHLVNEESAREAGISAFVMKPLTKREIARTIREVLDE